MAANPALLEQDHGRQIKELMNYIVLNVPPWVRLNRIVRDIPTSYIKGGLKTLTNKD